MMIKQRYAGNRFVSKKTLLLVLLIIVLHSIPINQVKGYDVIPPYEPQEIKEGDIPYRPYGNVVPKEYRCYLEAGHKYHVFLVGDWVTNNTEQATDYDIEVRDPSNVVVSINTESAGLPEQVANDEKHQYFIPAKSGDYRFIIYNDPKDSAVNKQDAAVFMIIEHIEMNTRYSTVLKGKPSVGAEYPSGYKVGYEFNTTEPEFLLYIDVPDPEPSKGITGLDMYEARVFPMANLYRDIGYNIQGVGVPLGEFLTGEGLENETYGKYNTSIPGFSFPDMKVSCEAAGVDMRKLIKMEPSNATASNSTEPQNIFYYLVMLAEYYEGEIEFYVKTDYRPVNITLIDPPTKGYTNETVLIKAVPESAAPVDTMWMEYTTDSWKTSSRVDLVEKPDYWLAVLPGFKLHDKVEYIIHAEDEIDNKGVYEGSFEVMNKVDIDFGLSSNVIQGGQSVEITGAATKPSIDIEINIEHEGETKTYVVQTDGEGSFHYEYVPSEIGEYDVTLSYAGDEDYHSAVSREKSFRVDKRKLTLEASIVNEEVKAGRPMTVSGTVSPPVEGLIVEVLFVSPDSSFTESVKTRRDGQFSFSITPETTGTWEMLPTLVVSELYDTSQGELTTFEVAKLNPLEVAMYKVIQLKESPLAYGVVGGGVAIAAGLVLRKEKRNKKDDKEPSSQETTSYRRRTQR